MAAALSIVPDQTETSPAHLAVANMRTPASARSVASRLRRVAEILGGPGADPLTFPWERVDYVGVRALRAAMIAEGLAPPTVNAHLAALKSCLKEVWKQERMSDRAYQLVKEEKGLSGHTEAGRFVDDAELAALFHVCKKDGAAGLRDAAALALLFGVGLRISEALKATLADYNPETGELKVRQGKGRKDRRVWLVGGAQRAIDAWIEARGQKRGPILVAVRRGGHIAIKPISPQALRARLEKRAKDAGVAHYTPHDGRRTLLSNLWDQGRGREGQLVAGHASIATTAKYDRRGEQAAKKALEGVKIPF